MSSLKKFFSTLLLGIVCIIFYGNTFNHQFSLDDEYITKLLPAKATNLNDCFKVFEQRYDDVNYRPIPVFTYALEKYLNSNVLDPATSHKINVLIFYLGVCMLFFTIMQLKIPNASLIALMASLLFVAHPIHSNVVSSIKNRDILLSFLFAISSIYFFLKLLNGQNVLKRVFYLVISSLLFFIAVISKIDSIWVIAIAPLLYIHNSKYFTLKKTAIRVFGIGLIFTIIYAVIRSLFISSMVELENIPDAEAILFTENPIINESIWGKIYYVVITLFYQIKFFVVPNGYYFYFGHKMVPPPHLFQPYFLLGIIFIFIALIYFFKTFKKDNPQTIGLIFMAAGTLYCTNIIKPVGGVVDPRLLFQASAGFCIFLAGLLYYISQAETVKTLTYSKFFNENPSIPPLTLTAILVLFYLPFTYSRNQDWKNTKTLIDADIPHLKLSFQANRIASYHYLESTKFVKEINERNILLQKGLQASIYAVRVDPNRINVQEGKGIAYNLLGFQDSAIHQFKYIIEKFDSSEVAWDMLGDIYYNKNKIDSASWCYYNTIRVSRLYTKAYYKYTTTMLQTGQNGKVKSFYKDRVQYYPNWFVMYDNLGYISLSEKDTLAAGNYYLKSFELGLKDKNLLNMFERYYLRKDLKPQLIQIQKIKTTALPQ